MISKSEVCAVFSARLRAVLKASDHTIKDLAREADCSMITVAKWLSGDNTPHGASLVSVANTLNVSTDWLLGRVNDTPGFLNGASVEDSTYAHDAPYEPRK